MGASRLSGDFVALGANSFVIRDPTDPVKKKWPLTVR